MWAAWFQVGGSDGDTCGVADDLGEFEVPPGEAFVPDCVAVAIQ